MGGLAHGLPHLGAEPVIEPGQQAVAGPLAEMMIDRLPGRKVFWQEPPLGAGFDQIEDGIENFAQGGARATAFFGGGQEAAQQVPLVVGEVGVVSGDFHRLKSAAANENRKTSQSNQAICALFFFRQALMTYDYKHCCARELVSHVRTSVTIDWTLRESAQAQINPAMPWLLGRAVELRAVRSRHRTWAGVRNVVPRSG